MTSFNSFDMNPCSVFTRCPFILAKIKETKVSWMFMNQRKKVMQMWREKKKSACCPLLVARSWKLYHMCNKPKLKGAKLYSVTIENHSYFEWIAHRIFFFFSHKTCNITDMASGRVLCNFSLFWLFFSSHYLILFLTMKYSLFLYINLGLS